MRTKIIALTIAAGFAVISAFAQRIAVTATTAGVQAQPTNYWSVNAGSISNAIGLGNSAVRSVGTTAGTVAAGDDSRIVGAVQTTRSLLTTGSLTGGGTLASDRTIQLSGDAATPGATKYYGTDSGGTKGWFSWLFSIFADSGSVTNLKSGTNVRLTVTNSEATVDLATNLTLTELAAGSLVLSNPVAVASGGTGATNAAGARANLGTDNADNLTSGTVANARLDSDLQRVANITYSTGDILYASASGLTNLGIGSSGQVLKVSGGLPSWGTDNSGSFTYDIDATGTSTNATAITLSTNALAADKITWAKVDVFGGGQTNAAAYELRGAYVNRAGTVSTTGTNNLVTVESTSALHSWLEVSGTNLLLKVQGVADENMGWAAKGLLLTHTLATNAAAAGSAPDNTLLVSLRFPEGSGSVTTNDGSGQTALAQFPSWVTGKSGSGYALRFNGSGDRISSTNNIAYNTNIITISLWMQLTNATASDKVLLESSPNYFTTADSFAIFADTTDTTNMLVAHRGTTGRRAETFVRPTDNAWHHLVVTFDGSTASGDVKAWLDTVSQSTTVSINDKTGTSNFSERYLYGAARNAGSLHLNCTLDDVRIYSGELSSDEILYLYNNPQ